MDRVGERVGDSRVDMFGDNILCQSLAVDGWRIRYDRIKTELMSMMGWSGMISSCEVWGLFQHLVPHEVFGREDVR